MLEGITYFGKALALRNAQLDVLTSNLANASTPGYKAKNLNFREAFAHALHESGNQLGDLSRYTQYERGNPVGLDGNSVSPQQTMMQITRTALNSEADESFAAGSAQSMIDAINTSTVY
ncbi:flagellar basal body protein [Acidithiobacillus ferrooxidans]|jgi:flagellar basal-body rod protein FlgB|uniref:flagellar basal body rod protein FlgB n=1 Tax=Acidithiobacillus ferrooxidans TaxID=920 RepID=UPI00214C1F76|nr:flagellar basal body protein [Acidithiobacillus ferrooxidans]MCR2831242.1 flagellar basal body protein [Acidithiobacillus ferrooxidans]MDA8153530.1 flagellar basal body protein [Acidithiobacillus sp.]